MRIIFQVTSDEIASADQQTLGFEDFDVGQQQSFLFFAVELKGASYTRGQYAQFTREINKRLSQAQRSFCSARPIIGSPCPLSIAASTSATGGGMCWAGCR